MIDPVPSSSLRAFLEEATGRYLECLPGSPAEEYLIAQRGLTRETIERFALGYVKDPLPGHENMRGRIAIPYLSPSGSVMSIRFRKVGDETKHKKYLSMPHDPPRIYNTTALEMAETGIVICEGEIDTQTSEQVGFPSVGIPGAEAWQRPWYRLFMQYNVVYMFHDDDTAGVKLAETIGAQLDNLRPIPMTGGDVNSFVRDNGPDALREKVLA